MRDLGSRPPSPSRSGSSGRRVPRPLHPHREPGEDFLERSGLEKGWLWKANTGSDAGGPGTSSWRPGTRRPGSPSSGSSGKLGSSREGPRRFHRERMDVESVAAYLAACQLLHQATRSRRTTSCTPTGGAASGAGLGLDLTTAELRVRRTGLLDDTSATTCGTPEPRPGAALRDAGPPEVDGRQVHRSPMPSSGGRRPSGRSTTTAWRGPRRLYHPESSSPRSSGWGPDRRRRPAGPGPVGTWGDPGGPERHRQLSRGGSGAASSTCG